MVESRRLLLDDGGLLLLHGDGGIGRGSAVGRRWRRWSCCYVMVAAELLLCSNGGVGVIVRWRLRSLLHFWPPGCYCKRQDKHSTITKIVSFLPTCLRRKLQLYTQRFYFVFELDSEVWNFD
ncbi:unnamed protein product [Sphagnum jensenii]|uniref:Uncharacterized protein n=1 Tax=Sphagnum jensenii TaxID=128206 RepID=A0ABP0WUT5_9BRYO